MKKRSEFKISKEVENLNLKDIVSEATKNNNWTEKEAATAEDWYRKHLVFVQIQNGGPIVAISKLADMLWHQHIIDTKKYASDCEQLFGRFLDHQPLYDRATRVEIDAFKNTVDLYFNALGTLPEDLTAITSGDYSIGRLKEL